MLGGGGGDGESSSDSIISYLLRSRDSSLLFDSVFSRLRMVPTFLSGFFVLGESGLLFCLSLVFLFGDLSFSACEDLLLGFSTLLGDFFETIFSLELRSSSEGLTGELARVRSMLIILGGSLSLILGILFIADMLDTEGVGIFDLAPFPLHSEKFVGKALLPTLLPLLLRLRGFVTPLGSLFGTLLLLSHPRLIVMCGFGLVGSTNLTASKMASVSCGGSIVSATGGAAARPARRGSLVRANGLEGGAETADAFVGAFADEFTDVVTAWNKRRTFVSTRGNNR
jgi:hypothetical protein